MDPQALYIQLGQLIAEMPDLSQPSTPEIQRWLARAVVLVEQGDDRMDVAAIRVAADFLRGPGSESSREKIANVLHRALARAELAAPAAARGAFIPVGAAFDVLQSVGRVLSTAERRVLIVDPYMDPKVLTDFAPLARDSVVVHLLSDREYTKPELLLPALNRWKAQFGGTRPLDARQTKRRALHDRYIFIDDRDVWVLTQSLKDMAGRSPAAITRIKDDTVPLKLEAFNQLWDGASPIEAA